MVPFTGKNSKEKNVSEDSLVTWLKSTSEKSEMVIVGDEPDPGRGLKVSKKDAISATRSSLTGMR